MKLYQKIIIITAFFTANVSVQSGGNYEITQSVVANGGGQSSGANFEVTGTGGQTLAGTNSTSGQYGVRAGFWQSFFAPSAAMASISGQILTACGNGISKVRVSLTNGSGATRQTLTNAFGYFRFDDVEVGQIYIISVNSKRFQFANNTRVLFVGDEITDLIFNALP